MLTTVLLIPQLKNLDQIGTLVHRYVVLTYIQGGVRKLYFETKKRLSNQQLNEAFQNDKNYLILHLTPKGICFQIFQRKQNLMNWFKKRNTNYYQTFNRQFSNTSSMSETMDNQKLINFLASVKDKKYNLYGWNCTAFSNALRQTIKIHPNQSNQCQLI